MKYWNVNEQTARFSTAKKIIYNVDENNTGTVPLPLWLILVKKGKRRILLEFYPFFFF